MAKKKIPTKNLPVIKYETEDAALAAVKKKANDLEFCSEEMKNNHDVVLAAVKAYAGSIRYASPEMRANPEIALATVKGDPKLLRFIRIEDMDTRDARNVVEAAAVIDSKSLIYGGPYANDPDIAIASLKKSTSQKTVDSFNVNILQNLLFLEGVGDIAKATGDEELLNYVLKRSFTEANGDPSTLEGLRYAIAHFEYNGAIKSDSYNFLSQELLSAQEGVPDLKPPFKPGEFTYEDDHHWDVLKEAIIYAEEYDRENKEREYFETVVGIYDWRLATSQSLVDEEVKVADKLEREYFKGDNTFRDWYYNTMASKDLKDKYEEEKRRERDAYDPLLNGTIEREEAEALAAAEENEAEPQYEDSSLAEKGVPQFESLETFIPDPPPELTDEEIEAEYIASGKMDELGKPFVYGDEEDIIWDSDWEKEGGLFGFPDEEKEEEFVIPDKIEGWDFGEESQEDKSSAQEAENDKQEEESTFTAGNKEESTWNFKDAKINPSPSAATWRAHNPDVSEVDFLWWDQYRTPEGDIDFDSITDKSSITFMRAKALILNEPENIKFFPEVPYPPNGEIVENVCYGRNDERLFDIIIKKHYTWLQKCDSEITALRDAKTRLGAERDPEVAKSMRKEIETLKENLVKTINGRPQNLERDSMLIKYAGQPIRERNTLTAKDGGKECITRKYTAVNPRTFEYVCARARLDPAIAKPAIAANPSMLKFANLSICNDPEVILKAYKKDPQNMDVLRYAGKNFFLSHMSFVADMIKEKPEIVAELAEGRLLNNKEFAMFAVCQNGESLLYFNSDIQRDKAIVEAALTHSNGESLYRTRREFVGNPSWAQRALELIPTSLRFFKYAIKGMAGVVKYAATKDPAAIRYATKNVRGDKGMAMNLVKIDGMALANLSQNRKSDHDVVLEAVKQNGEALQFASTELRSDSEIVFAAVAQNGLSIQFAGEEVKSTPVIAIEAIKQDINALGFVGKSLMNDDAFIKTATAVINESMGTKAEGEFSPYTEDEIRRIVGTGVIPEDNSTFFTRLGEGFAEVFARPMAKHIPVASDILKKAGHNGERNKSKTVKFDVDMAIKKGRDEYNRKKEETCRKEERPKDPSCERTTL